MSFNFVEFAELEEDEIHEWWIHNKLTHPGCPLSFKMVCNLVRVCHRGDEETRSRAIKECLGNVQFHYTNKDLAFFQFRYKEIGLVIPLDNSQLDINFTFLACLFGRYGASIPFPQNATQYPA